jgi:hypothetical protein
MDSITVNDNNNSAEPIAVAIGDCTQRAVGNRGPEKNRN